MHHPNELTSSVDSVSVLKSWNSWHMENLAPNKYLGTSSTPAQCGRCVQPTSTVPRFQSACMLYNFQPLQRGTTFEPIEPTIPLHVLRSVVDKNFLAVLHGNCKEVSMPSHVADWTAGLHSVDHGKILPNQRRKTLAPGIWTELCLCGHVLSEATRYNDKRSTF